MSSSEFMSCALQGFGLGYGIGFVCWAVRKVAFVVSSAFTPPGIV